MSVTKHSEKAKGVFQPIGISLLSGGVDDIIGLSESCLRYANLILKCFELVFD